MEWVEAREAIVLVVHHCYDVCGAGPSFIARPTNAVPSHVSSRKTNVWAAF